MNHVSQNSKSEEDINIIYAANSPRSLNIKFQSDFQLLLKLHVLLSASLYIQHFIP